MKLQSFLQESSVENIDISEFTLNIDPQQSDTLARFLAKFKAYNNISLKDINEDEIFLHISNGLIDFDFSITKDTSTPDGKPIVVAEIAAMVNHNYIHGHDKIKEHEGHKYALLNSLSREFDVSREERFMSYVDKVLSAAKAFEEWYFDVSGSVGKIKLIKITTDLEDGSSNNVWKWTPYAGQFWVDGEHVVERTA